jgi:glutamate synthase (NADPH/NADH) small chain
MDYVADRNIQVVKPVSPTGKSVAVIGAGPAGLSCAGVLAKLGHKVTLYEKRALPGGLSTYGIISLREPTEVAIAEVEMIRALGVDLVTGSELGKDLRLEGLKAKYDAVFLGVGLGRTPDLAIAGEELIVDGLEYIEHSKVGREKLKIGKTVLVIGAGNTAVDCATIAKRLGAESVTMVYRRTEHEMSAYDHEYEFIKGEGVAFRFLSQPVRVVTDNGQVAGLECVRMALGAADSSGRPSPQPVAGSEFVLPADQIVKAIGQERPTLASLLGLDVDKGYIKVSTEFETSIPGVFAGGDCVRARGSASTVMAVQDGKVAAGAIHDRLTKEKS